MGRSRLGGSVLVVAPWVLALVGALLLTRELSPPKANSHVSPPSPLSPPAAEPQKAEPPAHKEEVVFQPWEHVST